MLNEACGRWEWHVGRHGRDDDEVDLFLAQRRQLRSLRGGCCGHIARVLPFGGKCAFFDSGARLDPLVRGIDDFCHVVIRDYFSGV